jgi:hypothetical protein
MKKQIVFHFHTQEEKVNQTYVLHLPDDDLINQNFLSG